MIEYRIILAVTIIAIVIATACISYRFLVYVLDRISIKGTFVVDLTSLDKDLYQVAIDDLLQLNDEKYKYVILRIRRVKKSDRK